VIGFLRFIGIMNAAVWLGAAIFLTFGADPACFSADMKAALGVGVSDSYYPGAIAQVITTRYYHITLACGVLALLHLLAEWLYLGRPGRKFSFILLLGLFGWTLIGSNAVQPARIRALERLSPQHYSSTQPADRQAAAKSLHVLRTVERVFNVLVVCGLVIYTWRVANPSDNLRFVRPVQFRS
jgi:hypothetical protein